MTKQASIANMLAKTKANWPESAAQISPEILRIHRVSAYCQQNLSLILKRYDLQAPEFSVLETLRKEQPPYCLTPTELSSAMLFSSGGLTKVLNRMNAAGLIERVDNPNDKRGKLVKLSETGQSLIGEVIVNLHHTEQQKFNLLNAEERAQLNHLLSKILHVWEEST
ncbi:MarR family transcriptional regulator [Psychromonas sp. B3M02]|uniref:MarR family winged helix-turn-helix transcriptional regulator n=1 Tax=unclassified Psychromonas TaxID=2614957 RepID=UPI000DE8F85E|nr:MarR family transcriptional regulator [Psychromonas sp. B3M02]RBW41732.1 MarR family transcriptional regulator [Psychromonas sp. B3M02]